MLPALRWRRRLVVFGWVELDEKLFRSRCAVLTVFVVTFEFGRVSRGRVAFERSSAVDGVGRTVLVASLGGNPESLFREPEKFLLFLLHVQHKYSNA